MRFIVAFGIGLLLSGPDIETVRAMIPMALAITILYGLIFIFEGEE